MINTKQKALKNSLLKVIWTVAYKYFTSEHFLIVSDKCIQNFTSIDQVVFELQIKNWVAMKWDFTNEK